MKSLYYSLGVSYQRFLPFHKSKQPLTPALYTPQLHMQSFLDHVASNAHDMNNQLTELDTGFYTDNNKGTITFPSNRTFGAGYTFSPNTAQSPDRMRYQWGVFAEVDLMQWKSYGEKFSGHTAASSFSNTFVSRV